MLQFLYIEIPLFIFIVIINKMNELINWVNLELLYDPICFKNLFSRIFLVKIQIIFSDDGKFEEAPRSGIIWTRPKTAVRGRISSVDAWFEDRLNGRWLSAKEGDTHFGLQKLLVITWIRAAPLFNKGSLWLNPIFWFNLRDGT